MTYVPDTVVAQAEPKVRFDIAEIDSVTAARMQDKSYHDWSPVALEKLRLIHITYYDAEDNLHYGELVCHQDIAQDLVDIFRELYEAHYPIEKVSLIDEYDGDDEASMSANNSSAYNCRRTTGGRRLSRHAYGKAVDINPLYNPYIYTNSSGARTIAPANGAPYADRSLSHPYMIKRGDACHRAFVSRGFRWGGDWRSSKDYQHFDKR